MVCYLLISFKNNSGSFRAPKSSPGDWRSGSGVRRALLGRGDRQPDQFGERPCPRFFHDGGPVRVDGALADPEVAAMILLGCPARTRSKI